MRKIKSRISDKRIKELIKLYPNSLTRTELCAYGASVHQLRELSLKQPALFRKVRRFTASAQLSMLRYGVPLSQDRVAQEAIRSNFAANKSVLSIAQEFGYSIATIRDVINRRAPYNK